MSRVLTLLQSPLQLLSFMEACDVFDIRDACLVYESAGVGDDDRQFVSLAEQQNLFSRIDQVAFAQPEDYFHQHQQLVERYAQESFDRVFVGHIHQWMRDFLVGRHAEVYLLDDGMDTLLNVELTRDSGFNIDYQVLNWRYHREQPLREAAGYNLPVNQELYYFSFLNLNHPRHIRHQWNRLLSKAKPVAKLSANPLATTKTYFLGQGGWIHKEVVSFENYIAAVAVIAGCEELVYIPHRWDGEELIEKIHHLGVEILTPNQPWELFLCTLNHPFKVVSFTSTALLTSLYFNHCTGSRFIDIRVNDGCLKSLYSKGMNAAYSYLYRESQINPLLKLWENQ